MELFSKMASKYKVCVRNPEIINVGRSHGEHTLNAAFMAKNLYEVFSLLFMFRTKINNVFCPSETQ